MSPGDAEILLDRVYTSYARWRRAVENVEAAMQVNRRALAKRGGARTTSPVIQATWTILDEMQSEPRLLEELAVDDDSVELIDPVLPRDRLPGQGLLFDGATVVGQDDKPLDWPAPTSAATLWRRSLKLSTHNGLSRASGRSAPHT